MSRPILQFRTLSLLLVVAGFASGCETLYTDVYSPRPNRFVPPVEKRTVTELPPETTTTTTTTTSEILMTPAQPVEQAPAPEAVPDAAASETAEAIPGLEGAAPAGEMQMMQ